MTENPTFSAGDIVLKPSDFRQLGKFINSYTGIKMPISKKALVEGRLRKRLRVLGMPDFEAYCAYLFDHGGIEAEAVHLVDAITTNKTEFFREPDHFNYLTRQAIPQLSAMGSRTIHAWSAACSIGAEPYTLAMVLEESSRQMGGFDYSILGTDLSTEVLRKAADSIYSEEMITPVPFGLRQRYLLRSRDSGRNLVRISPELRRKVSFAQLNLMDDDYGISQMFHIIFCRNVLIYFEKDTQGKVLERLSSHLVPGGYLFLGHSETMAGQHLPLRQVAPTTFIKERQPPCDA